jgi:starch phosphorylase
MRSLLAASVMVPSTSRKFSYCYRRDVCLCVWFRLLNTVRQSDYYLITEDFDSYIACQDMVSEAFKDKAAWAKKSITTVANMGKFSSDRAILDYAESYWNVEPIKAP